MKKISSKITFVHKWIFPAIWILGILALAWTVITAEDVFEPAILIIPVFMAVFGYFLMKHLVFDLVDEVYDCGDHLLVKNRGKEDKVFLSDIINVNYGYLGNPPRVTLSLRKESIFGKEVTFSAPGQYVPFKKDPVINELILRIDETRSKR